MTERKNLEYLDLEITGIQRKRHTIDHFPVNCFSENSEKGVFKHQFHTKPGTNHLRFQNDLCYQLNTICDLLANQTFNTKVRNEINAKNISSFIDLYEKNRCRQVTLIDKLDLVLEILEKEKFSKFSVAEKLETLLIQIDSEPKTLERETVKLVKTLEKQIQTLHQEIQALKQSNKQLERKINFSVYGIEDWPSACNE